MSASPPSTLSARTDVLIVGAGPAGLTLAAALARLGVDHVVVEPHECVMPGSKAAGVQPRALECLDRLGLADDLITDGVRGGGFCLQDGNRPLLRASYADLDTPFPFLLLISQQVTEQHLERRLTELGSTVHREHRLLTYTLDFPGVTATIAAPDGTVRAVHARYLVGCDGVYSRVRDIAGIPFPGNSPQQLFALADVRLADEDTGTDTTFQLSPEGMLLTSPLPGGLHRIVTSASPGSTPPTAADVETLLATRGTGTRRVAEVTSASTYHVQERVAERLGDGPVFLAGDAAHTHSPAGGQGMNTGIQDAINLAWKLHAVVSGAAPARLLDTYHQERHPVAAGLIAFTSQLMTMATLRDPASARLRNDVIAAAATAPGATAWLATRLSQLDIGYATEPTGTPYPLGTRVPPSLAAPAGLDWILALPATGDGTARETRTGNLTMRTTEKLDTSLLIRPDGYLAARDLPTNPDAVLARLGQYCPQAAA
jgi:2-polyprenyl-6-methoxyphenol hydroxylase-like FAD-dependent oxidoreductase